MTHNPPFDGHQSYDPSFFAPLFATEDRHFWFRHRNQVINTAMRQVTDAMPDGFRVLEVGCGTGNVLRTLVETCKRGKVYGMDLYREGLCFARQRTTGGLVQGDMHAPPFQVRFDVIGLFDVLEHLDNDLKVLDDLHKMMVPGGSILLTVPAHQSLWSYFDEASHHVRRYEVPELTQKLLSVGFSVTYLSEYMAPIFPVVWLQRRLASQRKGSRSVEDLAVHDLRIVPVVNEMLAFLCALETRAIARRRVLPIGTSILAIATA